VLAVRHSVAPASSLCLPKTKPERIDDVTPVRAEYLNPSILMTMILSLLQNLVR
jgi:hypothetical protein